MRIFPFYLTGLTDFDCGLFRSPNLDIPIMTTDISIWNGAHGGCDWSAEDAYSSMAPDPTSGVTRGPCKPYFQYGLFHVLDMDTGFDWGFSRFTCLDSLILTADCSVNLIWTNWFWLLIFEFEVGLTAGVTCQQRMRTPPRHLILPSHLSGIRVALHSILYLLRYLIF